MSGTFDWRQDGPTAAANAYHAWRLIRGRGPSTVLSLQDAYQAGFTGGARWAVVATGNLAPSIASLISFVEWLRSEQEAETDVGALNGGKA